VQDTNKSNYFGIVVKSARQAKGMTQVRLAELLSISTRYLKAIENSGRKPSYDLLVRMIHELDISADALLHPEKEMTESSTKLVSLWNAGT